MNSAHKLLLAGAGLALVSAAVFAGLAWRAGSAGPIGRPALTGAPYTPVAVDAPVVKTETWDAPAPHPRGRDWVYDVFTPPEIFYHARTRQFAVKPPAGTGEDAPEVPFGVELIAVKRDPFRLQLIGYVGEENEARGIFENLVSGEVFLAAAGRRVPNLALSVKSFAVHREPVVIPDSMTVNQPVATAVIHDDKSRQDVTLTQRERHFTGSVFALVAPPGATVTREVRPGDAFQIGDATYRVESISLDPAAVEITKTAPSLDAPDRRTLPLRFDLTDSSASTSP
jgi:hypothetical protein